MSILHVPVTFANIAEWVRRAAGAINQLITGKQDQSDNLTSLAGLDLTGHSGDAVVVLATEDGFELSAVSGGSGIADGDYGDVTVSGSGTVIEIDAGAVGTTELAADAVTYAKVQNVSATDKLLGRSTAGAGDVEEIACTAAGRALLDDADAAAQRATLDLELGVDVQAYDADLAALAANSTDGLWAHTGAGTGAARTITGTAGLITVTNGDGKSGNPTITRAFSGALVKKSADQTGANYSAGSVVAWDSEVYDTDGYHDNSTNNSRLTAPVAGKYQAAYELTVNNHTVNEYVRALVMKNGSNVWSGRAAQFTSSGSGAPSLSSVTPPVDLAAGDYLEAWLDTQSDTSIDVTASVSFFAMWRVA